MNFHQFRLPPEIWESILDFCDTQTLINFQNVCLEWKQIVQVKLSNTLINFKKETFSIIIFNILNLHPFLLGLCYEWKTEKKITGKNFLTKYLFKILIFFLKVYSYFLMDPEEQRQK